MKKLILILALMFCLIFSVNTLAWEKVDVSGTNFDTTVIFVAKIQTFLDHGLGTSTTVVAYEEGEPILQVWGTCDSVDGGTTANPVYVHSVFTETGAVGRAAEFVLAPEAIMGGWGNAIKGYLDLTGAAGSYGLLSGICAEVKFPPSSMMGTIAGLEIELVAPGSFVASAGVGTNCLSFIYAQASGAMVDEIDDHGYFLNLQGLTDATGNMFFDNTIKCAIGSTEWFIPLSSAQASYTTAYPIVSTSTLGYSNTAALDPDATRSNHAFAYGWRLEANEVTATFENAADQNLEPIAINLNIAGADPSGTSTVNVIYQCLTHDTTSMPNIRLKQADWYMSIKEDVLDVYNMQLETSFGAASIDVGGEMASLGIVLDGGADAVVCSFWRGVNITMRGAGTPAQASGLFIRVESGATIAEGTRYMAEGTMTTAIRLGNISGDECPTNLLAIPTAGTGVTVGDVDSGAGEGSIKILVGGAVKYLKYWVDATGG